MGIASSVCTAVALVALSACRPHASAGPVSLVLFASAAVSALVLCLSLGIVPGDLLFQREAIVGGVLYAAIAGALIPIVVATWAVPLLGATRVAAFEVLAPVAGVCAALAWNEVDLSAWTAVGVVLVAAGLIIGLRSHADSHEVPQGPPEPHFFSDS